MPHELTGTPHHGRQRHVRMVAEGTYGTDPGSGHVAVPFIGDGFKLQVASEPYDPDSNFGGAVDPTINVSHKQDVAGQMTTLLWPEITQMLLDAALARTGALEDLTSYWIDYYTPVEGRSFPGCVAQSLEINASGEGDGEVQLVLDWLARAEQANVGLTVNDFDYTGLTQRPFMYGDMTMRIDDVAYPDVLSWRFRCQNTIKAGPYQPLAGQTLRAIPFAIAGGRQLTLELTSLHRNSVVREAVRGATRISAEARLVHPGGHNLQFQWPRLVPIRSDENSPPKEVAEQNPSFNCIAGPSGESAISYGMDLGPATTTLAGLTTTTEGA